MRLALVTHSSNLNRLPFRGDLSLLKQNMSDEGLQYDVQPWDKPDVQWQLYTHIILTSDIDYSFYIDEFLQWVRKVDTFHGCSKLLNSSKVIHWNYNKKYLLELESKDIKIPPSLWLEQNSVSKIETVLGQKQFGKSKTEVVVKNVVGSDGTSVWRCKTTETPNGSVVLSALDLEKLQKQIISPSGRFGVIVQEFLPAILTQGEWSLIFFDKVFSHAVVKTPPSDVPNDSRTEFRIQTRYGGHFETVPDGLVPATLMRFASQVLTQVPERLLHARVDVVVTGDGDPCLMELEVLDPMLYLTEPTQADRYLRAIQTF
jgi:glutathione synthase/RimK-type ligase-like ATP-grasp enzyme